MDDAASRPDAPRPSSSSPSSSRRQPYSRSQHRARSHDDAHAAEETEHKSSHFAHPLVYAGNAALITTADQLTALIDRLRQAKSFAYDSEFIGELTYVPKLCLVQVATSQEIALIDPLVPGGLNLTPFWELVCDPSIEKIVHAGQQDVEPAVRLLQREPAHIFDTQIAAGFAGLAYPVSLSKLVQELTGARLGKGLTFTHWDQRPLSAMQLRYAADDVRYLIAARDELGKRLSALSGHTEWAQRECAAVCAASNFGFDPDSQYLRVRGAGSLHPQGLAILRELTIWRNAAAEAHDVPPRAFLKDEILLDLARSPVKSVEKLDRVRGLPRPVEIAHGAEIVAAIARASALPPDQMPSQKTYEPSPVERLRADALWAVVQCLCIGQSIDADLVTSRQEIGELYHRLTRNEPIDEMRVMSGWRREAVSDKLLEFFHKGARVELEWVQGTLRATAN